LYSRDCVVWLMLAVRIQVVVIVATPVILVVFVAARVVLALVANGVILGVRSLNHLLGPPRYRHLPTE
jgi:hypothetical protein